MFNVLNKEVTALKREYTSPKAEKLIFDYEENIVASGNVKDGKTGHAANACYTHNASDVYAHDCEGIPKIWVLAKYYKVFFGHLLRGDAWLSF